MPNYNNYFPYGYQPYGYQQQFQQPMPNSQPTAQSPTASNTGLNGNIIWVQGEAGAKSYLVAPNTTVQLWDSESQTIYLKSADGSGMPSIKTLDYTIRENQNQNRVFVQEPQIDLSKYVTWDALEEKLTSLRSNKQYQKKEKVNE